MTAADATGTEPSAPNRGLDRERRRGFLLRLSDRTPLRTKLITALLALVIMALAAISVASVYMLRGYVTTQRDTQLTQALQALEGQTHTLNNITPGDAIAQGAGMMVATQLPGQQLNWQTIRFPNGTSATFTGPLPSLPTGTGWADSDSATLLTTQSKSGPDTWRVLAVSV